MEQGAMTPRERINQAESELAKCLSDVLRRLEGDIGMFPTDVDVNILDAGTYTNPDSRMLGRIKLRF